MGKRQDNGTAAGRSSVRRRRSLWVVMPVVLVGFAGVAPWVVPERTLKKLVVKAVGAGTNAQVGVDEVRLGWTTGFEVKGLALSWPRTGSKVAISRAWFPMEPVRLVLKKTLSDAELEGVAVRLDRGKGWPGAAGLGGGGGGAVVPVRRVRVKNLSVDVVSPDGYRNIVRAPSVALEMNEKKQTTSFATEAGLTYVRSEGRVAVPAGRFTAQGELRIVQQGDQQSFAGKVHVGWQDVDLSSLRLESVDSLDLRLLEGLMGGSLEFEIFPDLHFTWSLDTGFRDMKVQRRKAIAPGRIDPFWLVTGGRYDPVAGSLELEKLALRSRSFELQSNVAAHFEDSGPVVTGVDVTGNFKTSVLMELLPWLRVSLGPKAKISGPCRFSAHWSGKPPAYRLTASLNADEAEVAGSPVLSKVKGSALRWDFAVRADQKNWPWMAVEKLECRVDDVRMHGTGRLPQIQPTDDLDWWLDGVRRLGQVKLTAECPHVERLGERIGALRPLLGRIGLGGPVTVELAYTGQEDVGRTDVDVTLAKGSTLAYQDFFRKPVSEKLSLTLQGFWPWQSAEPQAWSYFFLQCGDAQLLNRERPAKLVWSFSKDGSGRARVDLVGRLAGRMQGAEKWLRWSPRLRAEGWERRLAGSADVAAAANIQLAELDSGWGLAQARVHLGVTADDARIEIPETFTKAMHTPLAAEVDYRFNGTRQRHELTTRMKWQDIDSRLSVIRSPEGTGQKLSGLWEFHVGDLNRLIEGLPMLERELGGRVNAMGKAHGQCRWSSDAKGDRIEVAMDGTDAGLVMDGREFKLPGVPLTFEGTLDLAKSDDPEIKTYTISKLESRLGQSFVGLKQGSIRVRRAEGGKWLKLLGVEPWLAWRSNPLESVALDVEGRLDADDKLPSIHPRLAEIIGRYGITGWTDFEVQARLENNQLHARVRNRLDNLGLLYRNVISKGRDVPGSVDFELSAWPDPEDAKAYDCRMDSLGVQMGPARMAGQGNVQVLWSDDKQIRFGDGQARVTLAPTDLSELSGLSSILAKFRTRGQLSAKIAVGREDGKNSIGPSEIRFDRVSGEVDRRPVQLDGVISFSDDYCFSWGLDLVAGESMLEGKWQVLRAGQGMTGTVDLDGGYVDTDELKSIGKAAETQILGPRRPEASRPATTNPVDYAGQGQAMAAFQPIRSFAAQSNVLVSLSARRLRTTDPRSDVRYDLQDFLCRLNVGKGEDGRSPEGRVQFWSRVLGGKISGDFRADLSQENPPLVLASNIEHVGATAAFKPLVENFFPGLEVTGTISIAEKNSCRMFTVSPAAPNYQAGEGKMEFVDGKLAGRAAPEWIAKIFPGLNFATYSFSRMHNWLTKRPDGVVHNNMIFLGDLWNIYIEGDSRPGGYIEYEIGVDLLARYESEYWSSVGQGRIPIFTTSGVIVNGKIQNQNTQYVPERLIYSVFVKNNAITGAYRLLRYGLGRHR